MADAARRKDHASDAGSPAPRNSERRMVGRALVMWEKLRQGRAFPSRADCEAAEAAGLAANSFLIRVSDSEDNDEVVACGAALRDALGDDPTGKKVAKVLPSATERGLTFWRVAAELKKPIADIGSFTNDNGQEVQYRSVLLPLSDDQERINYLLGAFSFRRSG